MSDGRPPVLQARERGERRRGDRRARQRPLDPLFAATLLNQITAPETTAPQSYPPKPGPRAGIAFDIEA